MRADFLIFDDEGDVSHRLRVQKFGQVGQHVTFSLGEARVFELKNQLKDCVFVEFVLIKTRLFGVCP